MRDRDDLVIAHVTHWNALMWDCGTTRTTVVEHGVVDPGPLYTGELERFGVVINEPVRAGRVVGTDLLPSPASPRSHPSTLWAWAPTPARNSGSVTVSSPSATSRRPRCTPRSRNGAPTCTRTAGRRSACR